MIIKCFKYISDTHLKSLNHKQGNYTENIYIIIYSTTIFTKILSNSFSKSEAEEVFFNQKLRNFLFGSS